jgi:hypothetical protein
MRRLLFLMPSILTFGLFLILSHTSLEANNICEGGIDLLGQGTHRAPLVRSAAVRVRYAYAYCRYLSFIVRPVRYETLRLVIVHHLHVSKRMRALYTMPFFELLDM